MWNLDREQADDLINTEMNEKTMNGIIIYDEGDMGKFSSRGRSTAGNLTKDFNSQSNSNSDSTIRVKRDIVRNSKNIGSLELLVTAKYLNEQLLKLGIGAGLLMLILFLSIVLLMNVLLNRVLISPLLQLVSVADAISKGELDQELNVQSKDEIGYLADSFKKMQVSLRLLMKRLSDSKRESNGGVPLDPNTAKDLTRKIRQFKKLPSLGSLFQYSKSHGIVLDDLINVAREEWKKNI
jgi:methyl-accepting chemotaxis protein